jgi:hypothetical protein
MIIESIPITNTGATVANRNIITSLTSMPMTNSANTDIVVQGGPPKVSAVGAIIPRPRMVMVHGVGQTVKLVGKSRVSVGSINTARTTPTASNNTIKVVGKVANSAVGVENTKNTSHNTKKTAISPKKTAQSILYP